MVGRRSTVAVAVALEPRSAQLLLRTANGPARGRGRSGEAGAQVAPRGYYFGSDPGAVKPAFSAASGVVNQTSATV